MSKFSEKIQNEYANEYGNEYAMKNKGLYTKPRIYNVNGDVTICQGRVQKLCHSGSYNESNA
ncbi:hypothetical protein RCZ04_15170 [Capnocytophaga sp. HP1101]